MSDYKTATMDSMGTTFNEEIVESFFLFAPKRRGEKLESLGLQTGLNIY